MNGRYVSLMKQAREEKDPIQKSTWIIEILDMMCTNDLLHIYDYLKKVNRKLSWAIAVGLTIILFLMMTHPEVLNVFKLAKGGV